MGLPWIRLDTNLPQHDKIIALAESGDRGLAAAFVYISSLAYSGAYATDGHITRATLKFIHGKVSHAKLLVSHQLWDETDRGWRVHNYDTKQVVGAMQQVISEQFQAAGKRGADARWGQKARSSGTWENAEANSPPIMADTVGGPDAIANGTERNGTKTPPRLIPAPLEPQRARATSLEAQRQLVRNNREQGTAS